MPTTKEVYHFLFSQVDCLDRKELKDRAALSRYLYECAKEMLGHNIYPAVREYINMLVDEFCK